MIAILRRILTAGLLAGLVASLAFTVVQQLKLEPLILAAEVYETAEAPHDHAAPAHEHAPGAAAHEHDADAWEPADGFERTAFTVLANILAGAGYGSLLVALMVFAGRPLDWRRGLWWGLGGFIAIAFAPSLGLPPELPGMAAAELGARQLWWIATALATGGALALFAFAPDKYRLPAIALGVALLLLPHLVGAPEHAAEPGALPAELAARFAVASLIAQAAFWAVLGIAAGHLLGRALPQAAVRPAAA